MDAGADLNIEKGLLTFRQQKLRNQTSMTIQQESSQAEKSSRQSKSRGDKESSRVKVSFAENSELDESQKLNQKRKLPVLHPTVNLVKDGANTKQYQANELDQQMITRSEELRL